MLEDDMLEKDSVKEYKVEKVHGYRCRNLQESHDKRTREIRARKLHPEIIQTRVLQADYSRIRLPKVKPQPVAPLESVSNEKHKVAKDALKVAAKKHCISFFSFIHYRAATINHDIIREYHI